MYSPFEAVYGHDRTHVRRMSVQDYLQERDDSSASGHAALHSRDSSIEFCSKYPVRDRFGHELCVLYQILEMDVQHELRRIERGGTSTRQSAVRLSAEIPRRDSDSPRGSSFAIHRDSGVNQRTRLPEPHTNGRFAVVSERLASAASFPSAPRERSNTASPCANEEAAIKEEAGNGGEEDCEDEEAGRPGTLRFTTVRPSELRATKQLFAAGRATALARRSIRHPNPISCQAYGTQRETIPHRLVAPFIAANLSAFCDGAAFHSLDAAAPPLRVGLCVSLGARVCRVCRYFASADVYDAEDAARPGAQVLLYRWSVRAVQDGANEAHRAALGLSLAAPAAQVEGFAFRDGGITAVVVPAAYRAVPLSVVPLSTEAFPTVAKLVLKVLSDLVAKRTVHGGLRGMNCVFIAMRRDKTGASMDTPPAMLMPVHWEGLVDFGMFVDRNAGRTIPIAEGEEGAGRTVYHSQDVAMVTEMLMEHELAQHLTAEQTEALRCLQGMTSEPTQIANYLIQLTNTMTIIPTDMASLFSDYELALQ